MVILFQHLGLITRGGFGEMMATKPSIMTRTRSPLMIHPTPTKTLLTTTFQSLVMQLSGLLVRGARLIDSFLQTEPTPQQMMAFELELHSLLREVGRRTMAWTLNHLEPDIAAEAPSRVEFATEFPCIRACYAPVEKAH
jgi:hypothetical protein